MIVVTLYTYQQLSLTRGFLGHSVVSSLASGSILVECLQKEGNVDGDVTLLQETSISRWQWELINGTSLVIIITYAEYSMSNAMGVDQGIGCYDKQNIFYKHNFYGLQAI